MSWLVSTVGQVDSLTDLVQTGIAFLGLVITIAGIIFAARVTERVFESKVSQQTINQQNELIKAFETRVSSLEDDVRRLSEQVEVNQGLIGEQEQQIKDLQHLAHQQAEEIHRLEGVISDQKTEIRDLRERAIKAETKLEVLKEHSITPEAFDRLEDIIKEAIEYKDNK